MRSADCDVGVFFPKNFKDVKKILVPLGMGKHSHRIQIASDLADFFNANMTIFTAVNDEKSVPPAKNMHDEAMKLLNKDIDREIKGAISIEEVILQKSKDYDLCIIGPSTEWILHDVLFGSLPDKIIKKSNCSVLIIKHPEQQTESWIGMIVDKIRKLSI